MWFSIFSFSLIKNLFLPSTENNSAVSSILSLFILANTPIAVSQSPSRILSTSLSVFAIILVWVSFIFSINRSISWLFSLHWIAIIPWPAQGTSFVTSNSSVILLCKFKDSIPAFDRMIASYSLFSNFLFVYQHFLLSICRLNQL